MSTQGKISAEEKIEAIVDYLSGRRSIGDISRKCNVSKPSVSSWIRLYKQRGAEG